MGKAKIRFGLELRPIHQKNKTNTKRKSAAAAAALKKLRQPSKAARMSGPAFRDMPSSNQSLLTAVYVADASKDMSDVMKDRKSK